MKRFILLILFVSPVLFAAAQSTVKYGLLSYDSLLHVMPEYAQAQAELSALRQKYEAETRYNEATFKRQFTEFLEGQKDFPQNILLKRQRDLQESMERGLAFRHEADSLLRRAEADLLAPVRSRLTAAIRAVGIERGYECVVNTDLPALPFIHPTLTEDATPFVIEKLGR